MAITIDQFKQAAWLNDFDTVKAYVRAGGNVNTLASNGVNALVTFNTDILEYLFENGGEPNGFWADGNPIIAFHAWEVNAESVKWFIEKGVHPDVKHLKTGETCLHNLTAKPKQWKERYELIAYLLNRGANPNLPCGTGVETGNFMRDVCVVGETALHRAAAYQSKDTIELLLRHGADPTIKDSRGESPLTWASRHWRDRDILKLLVYGSYRV